MTAPEPTPTAEHIDAVARALSLDPGAFTESTYGPGGAHVMASRFAAMDRARKLLASENPTVHAALAASLPADVMLAALVRAGVLPDVEALRHHLAIAEADASHLAATIRDARESLTRNRGRGAGWEKVSQALRPMGLSDALARAERRGRMRAVSAQPNPRFGEVAP